MLKWVNRLSLNEEKSLGSNRKTTQISIHSGNRTMNILNKKSCISVITPVNKREKRQKLSRKYLHGTSELEAQDLGKLKEPHSFSLGQASVYTHFENLEVTLSVVPLGLAYFTLAGGWPVRVCKHSRCVYRTKISKFLGIY